MVLPDYVPAQKGNLSWGESTGEEASANISEVYLNFHQESKVKLVVHEMARLFRLYAEGSAMEAIALKAVMILPALVLQKPFRESKTKDHIACIERRMIHWNQGNFGLLAQEVRSIQSRMRRMRRMRRKENEDETVTRKFTNLMMKGKTRAAMHLLSQNES